MQIGSSQSLAAPSGGGAGIKAQAEQLLQAAVNARLNLAEQNTIKAPPPGKGAKIDIVV